MASFTQIGKVIEKACTDKKYTHSIDFFNGTVNVRVIKLGHRKTKIFGACTFPVEEIDNASDPRTLVKCRVDRLLVKLDKQEDQIRKTPGRHPWMAEIREPGIGEDL